MRVSSTRARAALIVNPAASRVTPELVAAVERELRPAETLLTERPGHACELAAAASSWAGRVFVLAGDGGFNEAVNGIAPGVIAGFLPGGATSVLPRALGLPRDPVACARLLAASTRTRTISLGRVELAPATAPPGERRVRRFTFAAGLGLEAELVRAVDRIGRAAGRRPGDAVFVWQLARLLAARRMRLEPALTVGGRARVAFAAVANADPYTFLGRLPVHVAPAARFELGLDLVAPLRLGPAAVPQLLLWLLARPGGQLRSPEVLYVHDADRLEIECDRPTPLQADGEDLGDVSRAVFRAERGALAVAV